MLYWIKPIIGMYADVSNIVAGLRDNPAAQQGWVRARLKQFPCILLTRRTLIGSSHPSIS